MGQTTSRIRRKWKRQGRPNTWGSFLRDHLAWRDGANCCWCESPLRVLNQAGYKATIEHVVPLSRGGRDAWENLALACRACNEGRGNVFMIRGLRGFT